MKKFKQAWSHIDYAAAANAHAPADIHKMLRGAHGDTIADFGCGDGLMCEWLTKKGYEATGYDMVKMWPEAVITRIEDIDEDSQFDLGLCLGVLDHVEESNLAQVLTTIKRLVKYDIIFTIPIRDLGYNALLGRTIQATIKPIGWWRNQLALIGTVKIAQHGDWMIAHVR